MINLSNKSKCCGCNACVQICPRKCIFMKEDSEGFLYPTVNNEECISCGLCEKKCPMLHCAKSNDTYLDAYAAYTRDDKVREVSSSGGMFTVFANEILEQNGVVFGVSFSQDFKSAHHIAVTNKDDLYKLQGSKYFQSNTEDSYRRVEELLKEGKLVLYSGVACQIAGLKNYLQKDYDRLYTIDVLCHGVPSPKLWRKYINEKKEEFNNYDIKKVEFRNKATGWKNYSIKIFFDKYRIYQEIFVNDSFYKLFLNDIALRPSCHSCKYKDLQRPSDITIGDFWGIQNLLPEMDDDSGTSVVIVHSSKGKQLLQNIHEEIKFTEVDANKALPEHMDSRKSVKPHKNRATFFERLNDTNISELVSLVKVPYYKKVLRFAKSKIKRAAAIFRN